MDEQSVVDFVAQFHRMNQAEGIEPSFFELTFLMALDYFRAQQVDVAIIEVGLGGRLDSTNIITPVLSVITNISFDHMALLGNTKPLIAAEKAGIIKPEVPVVVGESDPETDPVFEEQASAQQAPLSFADTVYHANYGMLLPSGKQMLQVKRLGETGYADLVLDLAGAYQQRNVATVLQSVEQLQKLNWNISRSHVYAGLAEVMRNTGLQGRWQTIGYNPRIVCDTGHNTAGISLVVEQIRQTPWKRLHMVFGMVNDKDIDQVLELLPREAIYYFTRASLERALDETVLEEKANNFGLYGKKFPTVADALNAAKAAADEQDMIFVGGSTFVVAEII